MPTTTQAPHATPECAISSVLTDLGYVTRRSQARVLGEDPSCYSRYLKGHRSATCSKVQGWLVMAKRNGVTLTLTWGTRGCKVKGNRHQKKAAA